MDLGNRQLPWKIERQLRDLAGQFRRRQIIRAWIRFALIWVAGLPALGLTIHLLSSTAVPLIIPLGLFVGITAVLWWRWVYGATRLQPTRKQIALYIDEQHPELENLAISSLAFSDSDDSTASGWLIDQFFEHARTTASATRVRDLVNHKQLQRQLIGLCTAWGAVLIATVAIVGRWDLAWMGAQLFVRSSPQPIDFAVEPGDIRIRHGSDQVVWLTTEATSETVAIGWRVEDGEWVSNALQPSRSGNVYYHTFTDIQSPITYQIQAAGSQSPLYKIDVWTPPEVAWIDAVYRYPEYTGQPDKVVSAISAIEALIGTTVELTLHANQPVVAGQLEFAFAQQLELERDGPNTLVGEIEIGANDTFHVILQNIAGDKNVDNRPYPVTSRWDEVPEIRIQFPRGDDEATSLEEIPFAFSIKDDNGIWRYGIHYEIAGRDPERRTLGSFSRSRRSVDDTDLLFLEDLNLRPGDFLTWYVWADDGNPSRESYDQLSDPFFLEIRPFRRTFSEAVSNAGGQGGEQGRSAADQKQVIIATWNLRKTAATLVDSEFDEKRDAIITAQQEILATALEGESTTPDDFETIQRLRTTAGAAILSLSDASLPDPGKPLSTALRHEQLVHQLLLSLAPDDITVGRERAGSGRRGGNRQPNRELNALELTRRRDFAEEASTQSERLGQTEEVRKGIEDMAKRQTFINQDLSDLISERDQEPEHHRNDRRLERLIDEQRQNLSALEELAGEVAAGGLDRDQTRQAREGLAEAGRQMRQTLRNLEEDRVQRARSSGSGALRELSDVEEQLGSLSQRAAADRLAALAEDMDRLADQQKQILEDIRRNGNQPAGPKSIEQTPNEPLMDLKNALTESFERFMNQAGELAEKAEAKQGLASRRLNDWLRETSRDAIYEDIERGKDWVREGIWEAAERHEEGVLEKLKDARLRLETVTEGVVAGELEGLRRALAQVEGLVPSGEGRPLADPAGLSRFLEGDYRGWVEDIRSAEALLGENSDIRRNLTSIREDINSLRRRYRRDKIPPRFELVYDQVTRPLQLAAEELRRKIAQETGEYTVGIERLDAVPERYRKQVADYFKALSEIDISGDR